MPRPKRHRKTYAYSLEFKVNAVRLSNQPGVLVKDVADGLDIHPFMLSKWRKEVRLGTLKEDDVAEEAVEDAASEAPSPTEMQELARLRRELALVKKENDFLKKWQRFLSARKTPASHLSKQRETASASNGSASDFTSQGPASTRGRRDP